MPSDPENDSTLVWLAGGGHHPGLPAGLFLGAPGSYAARRYPDGRLELVDEPETPPPAAPVAEAVPAAEEAPAPQETVTEDIQDTAAPEPDAPDAPPVADEQEPPAAPAAPADSTDEPAPEPAPEPARAAAAATPEQE